MITPEGSNPTLKESPASPPSLRVKRRRNLRRLLKPRHVAFIGGGAMEEAIEMLRAAGFDGKIWTVNPNGRTIAGIPSVSSVKDLPEAPDASFLYVPKSATNQIVGELAEMGAGGAIGFASGYAEIGDEGNALQAELNLAAGDMAVVGPNSNGILNYLDGVALWAVHDHEPIRRDRGVAIISSSGGLLFNFSVNLRGVNPGYLLSVGNQGVLDHSDYLDVVIDDPRVSAIGLYIEDPGDVVSLCAAAQRATARGLPVVALKTGASSLGAMVAQTHCGAIAASDDWMDALFDRCGIIRAPNLEAFMETIKLLSVADRPRGRRMAVLTNGGGDKAQVADAASLRGLELPQQSPAVREKLRAIIPDFATVSNPFDYNAYYAGAGPDVFAEDNPVMLEHCYRTMFEDPYDIVVMMGGSRVRPDGSYEPPGATEQAWIATNREETDRCVVQIASLPEHMPLEYIELLSANRVAPLQGLQSAMIAIDRAVAWSERQEELTGASGLLPLPEILEPRARRSLWPEARAKQVLSNLGLNTLEGQVTTPDKAGEVARKVGFPVVVKVAEPVLAHKAKAGGVALNLQSVEEVNAAVARMTEAMAAQGQPIETVLLERMVTGARAELFAGVGFDSRFGHALLLGRGGTDIEELRSFDLALLPMSSTELERFVRRNEALKHLSTKATEGVVAAAAAVANFAASHRDSLVSVDVNPLLLTENDEVIAVDALVEVSE